MFGRIWSAIASVSASLEALSQTLAEGNQKLRAGFRLDVPAEEQEALPEPAGNGRRKVSAKGGA